MKDVQTKASSSPILNITNHILKWSLPQDLHEPIYGDVHEQFHFINRQSALKAYFWLILQTCSVLWHFSHSTQRGTFMFLISIFSIIAIVLMTFWLGGELSMYFDVPSILIVCLPAILVSLMAVGKETFMSSFKLLLNTHLLNEIEETDEHVKTFEVMGKTAMLMGWFGIVTGAIAIASNIKAEMFASVFGPAFAVMCLTLLYSLMMKTFCYVAVLRLSR
jgi:chemotaxis protein MotA